MQPGDGERTAIPLASLAFPYNVHWTNPLILSTNPPWALKNHIFGPRGQEGAVED
jgi:hypothetical protein